MAEYDSTVPHVIRSFHLRYILQVYVIKLESRCSSQKLSFAVARGKITLRNGPFYALFRFYATGSDRKLPEIVELNPAHQQLSVEVRHVSMGQIETNLQSNPKKGAILRVFPVLRNRKWPKNTGNGKIRLSPSRAFHRGAVCHCSIIF